MSWEGVGGSFVLDDSECLSKQMYDGINLSISVFCFLSWTKLVVQYSIMSQNKLELVCYLCLYGQKLNLQAVKYDSDLLHFSALLAL